LTTTTHNPPAQPGRGVHFAPRVGRHGCALRWPAVATLSGLVTLLSWHGTPWMPAVANIDSWQAGLALGFEHHLQWGPQIVFTFGPYGFVEGILPLSRMTAALGFLYALIVVWATAALVVGGLRRSWGLVPAAIMAWAAVSIAAATLEMPEMALALALGLALASLWADDHRTRRAWLAALGALAGFQILVEINVGLVTIGLLVLAVAGRGRQTGNAHELGAPMRKGAKGGLTLAALAPLAGVPAVALAAGGQSLRNFPSYLHGSLEVALGYASAMSSSTGRVPEDWFAVVDLALVATFFGLALRGRPAREKVAVALMLAGWGWELLKEGFVRHDTHDTTFFALMVLALCLSRAPRPFVLYQAAAIAVAAVMTCIAVGGVPGAVRTPLKGVTAFAQEVRDLVATSQFAHRQHYAVRQIRFTGDALQGPLLQSLTGYTVAGATIEDGMTFAYPQLRWDPLPILQAYSAYTAYLDRLDASFLASARAPQRILYQPITIDNRYPSWDPPATTEALYCHYDQIGTTGPWQVLARVADRCGQPAVIGHATVHFGQAVNVPSAPQPGEMVVGDFSLSSPLLTTVAGLLLKPPDANVAVWKDNSASPTTYRFIPGTAGDTHVLSVPRALGYSSLFSPPALERLQFSGDGWASGQGAVKVTFLAVPIIP